MMNLSNAKYYRLLFAFIIASITACINNPGRDAAALSAEKSAIPVKGYLQSNELPNSVSLLPPPPLEGSTEFALDEEYSKKSVTLRDTPAWGLAILDADLTFPNAAGTFSCALNAPIDQQETPHLYTLLQRTQKDALASTGDAKKHYQRPRPFMVNKQDLCTLADKGRLEKSGSYPSGHNAIGMAWALVLAEISPQQTDAILARGQAYGLSRIICNAHWHSDTLQGRYLGAYTVARLHANPAFRADLEAAKGELETVYAKGLTPARDCSAEKTGVEFQKSLFK
jgi:acid phosphatase (class A)